MKALRSSPTFSLLSLSMLLLLGLSLAACSSPTPMRSPMLAAASAKAEPTRAAAAPPMAPAPTKAPAAAERPIEKVGTTIAARLPADSIRKIIKNGEMNLRVADTDRAIDQVTSIAVDSGGYIISSQTTMRGDVKVATLTLGVPVEQFEVVQRQLRSIALKVLNESASGKDVTDEYVDLQSRLANLEATAARIRDFLKQAQTVEEALKVNAQLTEIEGQINQVKGRMNFLSDRSAFSTILVNLEPELPTPTPTVTPTPLPTPTSIAWRPGETLRAATATQGQFLRRLVDLFIWFAVLAGPFVVAIAVIVVLWLRWRARRARG